MRPLEYWKGERFLYGRMHESSSSLGTLLYNYIVLVIMQDFQLIGHTILFYFMCALSYVCGIFFLSIFTANVGGWYIAEANSC